MLAGLTDAEAMTWLDQARRNGMDRRFTVPTGTAGREPFSVENTEFLTPFQL